MPKKRVCICILAIFLLENSEDEMRTIWFYFLSKNYTSTIYEQNRRDKKTQTKYFRPLVFEIAAVIERKFLLKLAHFV